MSCYLAESSIEEAAIEFSNRKIPNTYAPPVVVPAKVPTRIEPSLAIVKCCEKCFAARQSPTTSGKV